MGEIIALQSEKILVLGNGIVLDRVQSLGITGNLPSEDIKELGNPAIVAVVKDTPEVTLDIEAFDVNCELITLLQGGDPHAATPPTSFPITVDAFKKVGFLFPVKEVGSFSALKTGVVGNAQVSSISYRYAVDGNATESMSFASDNKFWSDNSAAYESFTQGATPVANFNLDNATYGGTILWKTNTRTFVVAVDGVRKLEGTEAQVTAGTADYWIDASGTPHILKFGVVPDSGAVIEAIYPCVTTQVFDETAHETSAIYPGAIKGRDIPVRIATNLVKRVQSVNFTIDIPTESIKEMGNLQVVGTVGDIPTVSGDITVLDRDGDVFAALCNETSLASAKALSIEDFVETLALKVELLDPADHVTVLKTVYLPKITITTEGHTSRVGDRLTQTFGFKNAAGSIPTIYRGAM